MPDESKTVNMNEGEVVLPPEMGAENHPLAWALARTENHPSRRAAVEALVPMWDAANAAYAAARATWPDADGELRDRIPLALIEQLDEVCRLVRDAATGAAHGESAVGGYAQAADRIALLALGAAHLPAPVADALHHAVHAFAADDADAPVHDVLQDAADPYPHDGREARPTPPSFWEHPFWRSMVVEVVHATQAGIEPARRPARLREMMKPLERAARAMGMPVPAWITEARTLEGHERRTELLSRTIAELVPWGLTERRFRAGLAHLVDGFEAIHRESGVPVPPWIGRARRIYALRTRQGR
jgi:hypothetical protein